MGSFVWTHKDSTFLWARKAVKMWAGGEEGLSSPRHVWCEKHMLNVCKFHIYPLQLIQLGHMRLGIVYPLIQSRFGMIWLDAVISLVGSCLGPLHTQAKSRDLEVICD